MLDGICNYHLHFHQRYLVTRYRQVQFSQNQDIARTYFLFLPWAEPVLNNSVFIYSPNTMLYPPPLRLYSGSHDCLIQPITTPSKALQSPPLVA